MVRHTVPGGPTPKEISAKVAFFVAAVCDRRVFFGLPHRDGGRRPPLQAFEEISEGVEATDWRTVDTTPLGLGQILQTYPG